MIIDFRLGSGTLHVVPFPYSFLNRNIFIRTEIIILLFNASVNYSNELKGIHFKI